MYTNWNDEHTMVQRRAATWVTAAIETEANRARIVIASGDRDSAHQLAGVLRESDYAIMLTHDRSQALRLVVSQLPDLVLLDAQLSGDDGIALCTSLKNDHRTRSIPIIMTGAYDREEHLCCVEAGADDYLCRTEVRLLTARIRALLRAKGWNDVLVPIEHVVLALERAIEAKDPTTGSHLRRLGAYATLIGRRLGLPDPALEALRYGALLHDVGKIGIDDALLCKPGPLTDDEYRQIQQHPIIGEEIIVPLGFPKPVAASVRYHHERWDGRGYPDGLDGEAIPLAARIVAVVDAFDAMTSQRPYGQPLALEDAIARLRAGTGTRWDPEIVAALIDCLAEVIPCRERAVGEAAVAEDVPALQPTVRLR